MTTADTTIAAKIVELQTDEGEALWTLAVRRLRRDYLTMIAGFILIILALLAALAPFISSQILDVNYVKTSRETYLPVGAEGHVLGTDDLGRDVFSRLLYGARVSLGIALAAALISLTIGVVLGLIAGYFQGGRLGVVDDLLMWFIATLTSIPQLYLLITLVAVLGTSGRGASTGVSISVLALVLILAFLGWTGTMRLVRGETLAQREREYIIAAQAIGANPLRVMFSHILPNIFSVIIVTLAIDIGALILVESSLSYLGFGVQEPTPSWGNMIKNAPIDLDRWHLLAFPGGVVVITVLCLYLIGDGLRDAFDPRAVK